MRRMDFPRNATLLPFLCAALAAIFLTANILPDAPKPTRLWRGYYTLLVRTGSEAEGKVLPLLSRLAAGRAVVSRSTSPVSVSDFEGSVHYAVSELESRLDHLDPRFDPYLQGISGYFESGDSDAKWQIVYIPSYRNVCSLYLGLIFSLGLPGSWRLVELDPSRALLIVLGLIAFAFLLTKSLEKKIRGIAFIPCLNAVIWMPVALAGGVPVLCLSSLLSFFWFRLLRACASFARETLPGSARDRLKNPAYRKITDGLFVYLMACFLLPVLLSLILDASPYLAFGIAAASLGSLLLLTVPFPFYALRKAAKRGRAPFEPVPIIHRERRRLVAPRWLVISAAAPAAAVAILGLLHATPVPVPQRAYVPRDVSWESLLRSGMSEGRLPDLRDAVTHEAYQETLVFGRGYTAPRRDERVKISEYIWSSSNRTLVARERTVKVFDDAWLNGLFRAAAPGSLEGMLLRQQSPFGIGVEGPGSLLLRELPFALACLLAIAASCLAPITLSPLISGILWRFNRRA
jgi:hypothetical protein